ncbi:hypothetical protein BH18ACT4_BH18ACT4_13010 [soil metagenome]
MGDVSRQPADRPGAELPHTGEELTRIYDERFSPAEIEVKEKLWAVLCESFFSRLVEPTDTVLDLAAGRCEFLNAIRAGHKIAVDLNPEVERHARGATVVVAPSTDMAPVATGSVDVVFTSNFFEHLPSKRALLDTLTECRRVLRAGGRLIVLMPNIRYCAARYWDYLDHHLPLSHLSLVEALEISGFGIERVVPRFLPYTVKGSRLPPAPWLVRLYLRMPVVWPIVGKQMLVVGRAPAG